MEERILKIDESVFKMKSKDNVIYFVTYDTTNLAKAAVKHIYDLAISLKKDGYNAKILVEDNEYAGVDAWLDESYSVLEVVSIKEDKVKINFEDVIVIPEIYSNILPQISNITCSKVMLVQQEEFMYDTLEIGRKWSEFGVERAITTNKNTKKRIEEVFPDIIVHVIPPFIGDEFTFNTNPKQPIVSIHCRHSYKIKKTISEFYLKHPQLKWISFRDMTHLSYNDFADAVKNNFCAVWIDDISTFGTFPLECMKAHIPVIGVIPNNDPEWIGENGLWVHDENKLTDTIASFIFNWISGGKLEQEVYDKMDETVEKYTTTEENNRTVSVFESIINKRIEVLENLKKNIVENGK